MKRFRDLAIFTFFSLALAIIIAGSVFNYYLSPVSNNEVEIDVEVSDGKDIDQVADILYDNKLIRNPKVFKIYVRMNGIKKLKEGTFTFKQNMSSKDIVRHLEIIE